MVGCSIGILVGYGLGWVSHAKDGGSDATGLEEARALLMDPDGLQDPAAVAKIRAHLPVDSIILEHSTFAPTPNYRVVLALDGPSICEVRALHVPMPCGVRRGRFQGAVGLQRFMALALTAQRLGVLQVPPLDPRLPPEIDGRSSTLTIVGWGGRITHSVTEHDFPEFWTLAEAIDGVVQEILWREGEVRPRR